MSKRYCIFITTLFCAVLALFLAANVLSPARTFSPLENRYLAQLPAPAIKTVLNGSFMSGFETYMTDQFVGRDFWIAAKSFAERSIGKQENNGVYFCSEDTLITRFEEPDPDKVAKNLEYVRQFSEQADIPVYFSLIPGAVSIWSDRLPLGAPNADQRKLLAQAASTLPGEVWYDTFTPLWSHRDEPLFYRTDHHWTSLGAYYGYTALMDALGIEPVPLEQYTKTTVSNSFYGTVFSSSGVRWVPPDSIDLYVPDTGITVTSYTYDGNGRPVEEPRSLYVSRFLQEKDQYSLFLGGNQPLGVVRTGLTGAPKLAIIRDSYTDSLVPFLTAHFSEIHLIDLRYYKLSIDAYLKEQDIGLAVVLYSVANFTSDGNLAWLSQ